MDGHERGAVASRGRSSVRRPAGWRQGNEGGGAKRIRTADLLRAREALSQAELSPRERGQYTGDIRPCRAGARAPVTAPDAPRSPGAVPEVSAPRGRMEGWFPGAPRLLAAPETTVGAYWPW